MAMISEKLLDQLDQLKSISSQLFIYQEVSEQNKFRIEDIVAVLLQITQWHNPSKDYGYIIAKAYPMVILNILHKNHCGYYPSLKVFNSNYIVEQSIHIIKYQRQLNSLLQDQNILMILSSNQFEELISSLQNSKQFQIEDQELPFQSLLSLIHIIPIGELDINVCLNNGAVFIMTKGGNGELIKKTTPCIQNLKMNSFDGYYKQRDHKDAIHNQIESLIQLIKEGKKIQVLKAQYPHGYHIEVKYSQITQCWIISTSNECLAFRTRQHITQYYPHKNTILKQLALFWFDRYHQNLQLKKLLDKNALKGIVNYSLSQAKWYGLQKLNLQSNEKAQDPNIDQIKIQQASGLSFVKINKLGTAINQDQLHRIVEENARKIYLSPYQESFNQYGRCRIHFLTSQERKIEHSFNLLTFQDQLFKEMQLSILNETNKANRISKLKQVYFQLKSEWNIYSAYPFCYYQKILIHISLLLQTSQYASQFIELHWQFIVKLALYMSAKRISIPKYSSQFIHSQSIRKKLSLISFENFGPIACKIINFFTFISVGSGVLKFRNLLKQRFQLINQHFQPLGQINISQPCFIQSLSGYKNNLICNYFLQTCPQSSQWQQFLYNFWKSKIDDTVCKLIVIGQPQESYYKINGQIYPFSIQTISNAYFEAYNLIKTERLIKDKTVQLQKITTKCKLFIQRNLPQKIIQIKFHEQKELKQIEQGIQIIFKSNSNEDNIYYLLIARIQKYKLQSLPQSNLTQQHITLILTKLYFNIPVILPENLL